MIYEISVVNQLGSKTYRIGDAVKGGEIAVIKIAPIYFTGDPFCHYCGFDKEGKLLFSIEPSCPCEVEYK